MYLKAKPKQWQDTYGAAAVLRPDVVELEETIGHFPVIRAFLILEVSSTQQPCLKLPAYASAELVNQF